MARLGRFFLWVRFAPLEKLRRLLFLDIRLRLILFLRLVCVLFDSLSLVSQYS